MPSNEVIKIIQDANGFLWFGTTNGISKFDGKRFRNYGIKDGLNSTNINALVEGNNGEIYVAHRENGINIIKDDKISNLPTLIDNFFWIGNLFFYKDKLYGIGEKIHSFDLKNNYYHSVYEFDESIYPIFMTNYSKDEELVTIADSGLAIFKDDKFRKINIKGLSILYTGHLIVDRNKDILITSFGQISIVKNLNTFDEIKLDKKQFVGRIYKDRRDNIWFSYSVGLYVIQSDSKKIINIGSKSNLQNSAIHDIFEDKEGNIWILTFNDGIYCFNNFFINNYTENDGLSHNYVLSMGYHKSGKLIIGTFNGLNIFDGEKFEKLYLGHNKIHEYIRGIKIRDNEVLLLTNTFYNDRRNYNELNFFLFNGNSSYLAKNGNYIVGGWYNDIDIKRNFYDLELDHFSSEYVFDSNRIRNQVIDIFEDLSGNLWFGTVLGLCKFDNSKKVYFKNDEVLSNQINAIIQDKKGIIWVAGSKGIASYNINNDIVRSHKSINGFDLSSSGYLAVDNDNRLWIGSKNGLFVYEKDSIRHLNYTTGLLSDEITELCYDSSKNYLYIGSKKGISFLDINLFENQNITPLNVYANSVSTGDTNITNFGNLVFEPGESNIYIDFSAPHFSSPGSIKYRYKLNNEWIETDDNHINFSALQSGIYNLEIMAKAQNTNWGKPYVLSFEIKPYFTETFWFKGGLGLFFVLFSLGAVKLRTRQTHKKAKQEILMNEKINSLKHQALSAMMHPHFIFNALNSVQYLVNCKRNEEANDYIAMMALLIRKNLNSASEAFILLSEEINRLRLYLQIEQLRFDNEFSYEITTSSNIDTNELMIPNMIVQPFVENTLWHGIKNSGRKGFVVISFSFAEVELDGNSFKSLIIKIRDNGKGINEAKKNKRENHVSLGIKIIEERLQILSSTVNIPNPIMFEDLSSRNNDSHGTEVIISLPPPLYKTLNKDL